MRRHSSGAPGGGEAPLRVLNLVLGGGAWHSTRAKAPAGRGEASEARGSREAFNLSSPTDALNTRAEAMLSLARALGVAGQEEEAASGVAGALQLYEAKANVVASAAARALLTPGAFRPGAA
jgi:hypothetical protein